MSTVLFWVGVFSIGALGVIAGIWLVVLYLKYIHKQPSKKEKKILNLLLADMKTNNQNWVYLERPDRMAINDVMGVWIREAPDHISIFTGFETTDASARRGNDSVFELKISKTVDKYINKMEKLLKNKQTELDFLLSKLQESDEKPNKM